MATTVTEYPRVLSASTLENEKVVNAAGENLGNIEDYMIDLNNGRIAYCVLSFGGFLGLATFLPSFFYSQFHVTKVQAGSLTVLATLTGSLTRVAGGWRRRSSCFAGSDSAGQLDKRRANSSKSCNAQRRLAKTGFRHKSSCKERGAAHP